MKLHLPKALLTMVLAACIAPAVWAASDNTDNSGWDKIKNGDGAVVTDSYGIGDSVIQSIDTANSANSGKTFFIRSNNGISSATVENFIIAAGDTAKIDGWWTTNADHPEFSNLTINHLTFTNDNSFLYVEANNTVLVNSFSGTLCMSGGTGTLKLKASENHGTIAMHGGASINFTDGTYGIAKLDIHNRGTKATTETLTISGATVKITGTDGNLNDTTKTGAAAVTVGHWHDGTGKIIVGGDETKASLFDVSGATIRMSWDSSSALEIKANGTINVKGIQFGNYNASDEAIVTLSGGRLNLGEGGVSNFQRDTIVGKRELNLNSGTLGALDPGTLGALEVSVDIAAGTTNIGGAVTIDTAAVNAEGEKTGKTANISFSNNVVLSNAADVTITGGGGVSFNALTLNNSSTINIKKDNTLTLNDDCTFTSASQVTGDGTLVIGDGANVKVTLKDSGDAAIQSNIRIDGGGTLTVSNKDGMGWGQGYKYAPLIELKGTSAEKTANLVLSATQTLGTNITMSGFATISGAAEAINPRLNNGITISVSGTENLISAGFYMRSSATLNVAKDAELNVTGKVSYHALSDMLVGPEGYDGSSLIKKGEGKVTFSNASNVFQTTYYNEAGETVIDAAAQFKNGIKVSGGEFTLNADINLASGKNIQLDGGVLNLNNKNAAQILTGTTGSGNITVGTNITLTNNAATQVTGKLAVKDAALTLGEGDAYKNNDFNLSSFSSIDLTDATVQASLNNFTGAITISRTKDDGQSWLRVNASQNLQFKDITLGGGAKLEIYNKGGERTTVIDKLTIDESGVIGTFRDGSCYQGTININKLSNAGTSAELTLKNASQTDDATVINLNGGTFTGTIKLESDSHRGGKEDNRSRDLQVNLKNVNVAAGSIIAFQNPSTADGSTHDRSNYITLGVGVEGAKVAGLTGTTTNAATIKATEGTKTLEIITAADADYSTNAKVENSINLVKSGAGKQTITGAVNANSITLNDGELQLSGTVATSGIKINAGELSLNGTGDMDLGTVEVLSGALNIGSSVTLTADIKLTTGSEISLNGYESAAATIHGTVELGKGLELSGTVVDAIYDLKAGEKLLLLHADNVIFGDVNEAAHGEYANLAMAADAMIEATPLLESIVDVGTYFSSLNVEDYKLLFENGALYIQASNPIPEPTTATLSLLALAALASRRRRK